MTLEGRDYPIMSLVGRPVRPDSVSDIDGPSAGGDRAVMGVIYARALDSQTYAIGPNLHDDDLDTVADHNAFIPAA